MKLLKILAIIVIPVICIAQVTQLRVGTLTVTTSTTTPTLSATTSATTPLLNVTRTQLTGVLVANLPTCNSGATGSVFYVTDAFLGRWGDEVFGGGTRKVIVVCDGTAYFIMGADNTSGIFLRNTTGPIAFRHPSDTAFVRYQMPTADSIQLCTNLDTTPGNVHQDDTGKSSWCVTQGHNDDSFAISRAPAGSATNATLFKVKSGGRLETASNCSSSASPAVCSSAPAGSVNIAAAATTIVVNTTAITANSQILIMEDSSLGTKLSVTCNTTLGRTYAVTARTAATSFTITTSAAPVTNPACLSYFVIN